MNNNLDNGYNQDENYENNEEVLMSEEDERVDYEFDAQEITIPEVSHSQINPSARGLRIFCVLLAAVIALSCTAVGGYFYGKYSAVNSNKIPEKIVLEGRPDAENAVTSAEIYQNVSPSVVGIYVYSIVNSELVVSSASGVVYSSDGYIITNDHIYSDFPSAKFKIFTHDSQEYDAVYVAGDTRSDLAILKITDKVNLTPAIFGDSDEVITGEMVCAIGYPNGYSDTSTITRGIISDPSVRKSITTNYSSNFIQTDTAINPGNSGGALVNMFGQVVGITSSKIAGTAIEGVGFAIPTTIVKRIGDSLIKHGRVVDRAMLGITYTFHNSVSAETLGFDSAGLLVMSVGEASDLYNKIEPGDYITHINEVSIIDDDIILDIIDKCSPDSTITLTAVNKAGETFIVSAKLVEADWSTSYTTQ